MGESLVSCQGCSQDTSCVIHDPTHPDCGRRAYILSSWPPGTQVVRLEEASDESSNIPTGRRVEPEP